MIAKNLSRLASAAAGTYYDDDRVGAIADILTSSRQHLTIGLGLGLHKHSPFGDQEPDTLLYDEGDGETIDADTLHQLATMTGGEYVDDKGGDFVAVPLVRGKIFIAGLEGWALASDRKHMEEGRHEMSGTYYGD